MSKVTLTTVSGTGSIQTFANNINNNSQAIEEAFDNTLSRDGTSPNEMNANLDMNSYRILNLSDAVSNSEPVTLSQVSDVIESAISSDPERFRGPQGIQGIQGIKGDSGAIALTLTRNQIRGEHRGEHFGWENSSGLEAPHDRQRPRFWHGLVPHVLHHELIKGLI